MNTHYVVTRTTFPQGYTPAANTSIADMAPFERPFDDTTVLVTAILIFTMLVVGVILNSVTMAVILKYKKLRNLFVYFIFSLCLSDLLSALISPLNWHRRTFGFDHFVIPDFFCKLFWGGDFMTSIATAMHIAAFGVFRLISIADPHLFAKFSNRLGILSVIIIWTISLVCGFVPYFMWFGARERDRDSSSPDARWPACTINMEWYENYTKFQKIAYPIFLLVPFALIVTISVMTCLKVYATTHSAISRRSVREKRKEKQALLQLTLIVVSFLFGYVPFIAYEYWSVQSHDHSQYTRRVDYYFGYIEYIILRFSECMNPVFYNLGSTKMRWHTRHFLRGLFGKFVRVRTTTKSSFVSLDSESKRKNSAANARFVSQAQQPPAVCESSSSSDPNQAP